MHLVIWKWVYI